MSFQKTAEIVQFQKNLIDQYIAKADRDQATIQAATRQAADWEVQAQDLHDQLVQAERERDALRAVGTKLANYLETATEIFEDGGDEDDAADARALVAQAREILPPQPDLCEMALSNGSTDNLTAIIGIVE